jgi:hypothetical protein
LKNCTASVPRLLMQMHLWLLFDLACLLLVLLIYSHDEQIELLGCLASRLYTCTAGDYEWTVYITTLNCPGGRLSFCSRTAAPAVVPVFKAPISGVASLAELAALHCTESTTTSPASCKGTCVSRNTTYFLYQANCLNVPRTLSHLVILGIHTVLSSYAACRRPVQSNDRVL